MRKIIFLSLLAFLVISCESEAERKKRLAKEKRAKIELQHKIEQERIAKERLLEKKRKKKAIYDKYINNSLLTGATPYSRYYGRNHRCNDYGCSKIKVKAPINSEIDVLVIIKKHGRVFRHAYINSGDNYTFSFPNGTYQAFFYYGKGWNPNKLMKKGTIKGGFIDKVSFDKDSPQTLKNNILTYELILQQNGNFMTRPSNEEEAL